MKESAAARDLQKLASRYWDFECQEFPFAAVLAGEDTGDAVLFRESPDDYERKCERAVEFLAELDSIAIGTLDAQDSATHKLMQRELEKIRDFHGVKAHLRPSLFPAGPDFNLRYFANSTTANTADAADAYVERLATVAGFVADLRACLAAGHEFGFRYPKFVLKRAADTVRAGVAPSAAESPLFGPFERSTTKNSRAVHAAAERATSIIEREILPALDEYATYLGETLIADGRDSIACTDDPLGAEFYELLVRNFTSLDLSADEVHELGLEEVERVQDEIARVAAEAGFADRVGEYIDFVTTDQQFIAEDKDSHLNNVLAICKSIDMHIPAFFGQVPRITYSVKCIPEDLSESMPPAYAQPSPADNTAPGIFWLSSIPGKCPSFFYRSLALHEAWPGHLMQIALMQEQTDLPKFRRNGALKYTACIEGWAMYCENLGVDMGIYETPHDHFGRLLGEIWRAVRLVVDTGIHIHGWSRDKAIDYMDERVPIGRETVVGEIDRYIALPGQALAYQPGNLKFRELRARAEQRLGDDFDIRSFHDTLIAAGPVTLPILDDLIEHWLSARESAAA